MAATAENPFPNDTTPHTESNGTAAAGDEAPAHEASAHETSDHEQGSSNESKPLYALAGAADTAVGFLRELPNRLVDAATDTSFRDQVRTKVADLPEDAKTWRPRVNELVEQLPAKTHEFPGRMSEFFANVSHDAGTTYDDLAVRGEGAVTKWRGEYGPKVDELVDTVKSRVSRATDDAGEAVTSLRGRAAHVAGDMTGVITGTKETTGSNTGSGRTATDNTATDNTATDDPSPDDTADSGERDSA